MNKLTVCKIGGNIINKPESLSSFLDAFSSLSGNKILVHGGGRSASSFTEKLGLKPQMVNGRRVTDIETLKIVTMVYGGLINKNIVAQLQSFGCHAVGLTGADLNVISSAKRSSHPVDYGFVGDIKEVNSDQLNILIQNGISPVLAPLTHDKKGNILNTNADDIAAEVANNMIKHYSVELIYFFELNGVLLDIYDKNSVIKKIKVSQYEKLVHDKIIAEGMIPKIESCIGSINAGVSTVRICHFESISKIDSGLDSGTIICR